MPHSSLAIANTFLSMPGGKETLTQMALQKLAFIANGWNQAINLEPLINETAEAWTYGPVYRSLYEHTKFFGKEPIRRLVTPDDSEAARVFMTDLRTNAQPYQAALTDREGQVVRHVWSRYGRLTGGQLSELTHMPGTPWYNTITTKGRNAPIDPQLIQSHYDQLAQSAANS